MVTNFGEVNPDSVYYKNVYGGAVALPGKYALATIRGQGVSGSPSIDIIDLHREPGLTFVRDALRGQ